MTRLNILTGKVGDAAADPIDIQEIDFWETYLKILNTNRNAPLLPKEIAILSRVLSHPVNEECFKGRVAKSIMTELRIKPPDFSKAKGQMILKGVIVDRGLSKGGGVPHPNLQAIQRYVKTQKAKNKDLSFQFIFSLRIVEDEQ